MFFFLKLAFGNVIKNKKSVYAILFVVAVCVLVMQFTVGYMDGFKDAIINSSIRETGHVNVYNKKFYDNLDFSPVQYNMKYDETVIRKFMTIPGAESVRAEINFGAIANSEKDSKETLVKAIDINSGGRVYDKRKRNIRRGGFIEKETDIVIGEKMAGSLELDVNDSLILLTVDSYGALNAVEGRVAGIFRNFNPAEESSLVICYMRAAACPAPPRNRRLCYGNKNKYK